MYSKDPMTGSMVSSNVYSQPGGARRLNPVGGAGPLAGGGQNGPGGGQGAAPMLTATRPGAMQPAAAPAPMLQTPGQLAMGGAKTAFVRAFVNKAGDQLTPELCKRAADALPAALADEKAELEGMAKEANGFWRGVRHYGGQALSNVLPSVGGMIGGATAGAGVDTLAGMGGMETNFSSMGAGLGAAAGLKPVRRWAGTIANDAMGGAGRYISRAHNALMDPWRTPANFSGKQQAYVGELFDKWRTNLGFKPSLVNGSVDASARRLQSGLNPGENPTLMGAVRQLPAQYNPLKAQFWNPAHNWDKLDNVQRTGRVLGGAAVYGGAADQIGRATLGYSPINLAEAGRYHANKELDRQAQRLNYGSWDEAVQSPVGQALAGYNKGGIGGALSGAWGAMADEDKQKLYSYLLAGGAGLGALGAFASGNNMLGAGLGLGAAAAGAYGAMSPGNPMQQVRALDPQARQQLLQQIQRSVGANQFMNSDRMAQMDYLRQALQEQAAPRNELSAASAN